MARRLFPLLILLCAVLVAPATANTIAGFENGGDASELFQPISRGHARHSAADDCNSFFVRFHSRYPLWQASQVAVGGNI